MIFGVSKTTIEGILSLITTICLALTTIQIPANLQTTGTVHIWAWVTFILTVVFAISTAVVRFLQNDAPPAASIAPITVTVPVPVTVNPIPKEK